MPESRSAERAREPDKGEKRRKEPDHDDAAVDREHEDLHRDKPVEVDLDVHELQKRAGAKAGGFRCRVDRIARAPDGPGEPDEINRPDDPHRAHGRGHHDRQRRTREGAAEHHDEKPKQHVEVKGQHPHEALLHAVASAHDVVRPRCDRRDEGIGKEGAPGKHGGLVV